MSETHQEIERVWVLREAPVIPASATTTTEVWEIEQGYFAPVSSDERDLERAGYPEGRVRRVTDARGAQRFFHTRKSGSGMVRVETERELTRAEFDALWPGTLGRRIAKTRSRVRDDRDASIIWEIDVFHGIDIDHRPLVMLEVELAREDHAIELPAFLAPLVVKEVTFDASYRNSVLAR